MKKSLKIISVVLALVLIVSVGTVMLASNAENSSYTTTITVETDKEVIAAGETATVTVKATTNYAVATMSIPVFYDKALVEVSDGTAPLTKYATASVTTDLTAVDTSNVYKNINISSDEFGFVLATYIAGADTEVDTMLTEAVVLTFKVKAKADVSGEAIIKIVTESVKTDDNIQGMLYFGAQPDGNAIDTIPENVDGILTETISTSVFISNGAPELKAIDGTTGYVDTTNKYIYGITIGGDVEDFFTVENGIMKLVANASGVTNGTGATVQVIDSSENVVDTYTVVIFGDVNGDGAVTATDANIIKNASLGGAITGDDCNYAADVNCDGSVTATDANIVKNGSLGGTITINPYA